MAALSRPHSPTVLVVDDEQMMRSFLTRIMEFEHYQVYAAADGVEALTILENVPSVDLVISDVRMPRMDGRQLAVELSRRHPHTPIVLISGAYLGGACDLPGPVLPKPFTAVALASRVREVLAAQHEQPRDSYSGRVLSSEREPPLPPSV